MKKTVSLLLVVLMLVGMLPVAAIGAAAAEVTSVDTTLTVSGYKLKESVSLAGETIAAVNDLDVVTGEIGDDGTVVLSLIEGETYTVTVDGYASQTITGGVDASVTLQYTFFTPNEAFDLSKQNDGQISLLAGGTGDLWFQNQYNDFKFTINVNDHPDATTAVPRNQLLIMFTDGQLVTFDVTTHGTNGQDFIQSFGGNAYLQSWANHGYLTEEESALYRSAEGVDFTVMRRGQYFTLSIGERVVKVVDLSANISMDTKCGLRFRHWDDAGVQLDYNFSFEEYNRVPVKITGHRNGELNNLSGVTTKVANANEIVWPTYNENGELVASLIEGIDYQFIADGYVSQIINVQEGSAVQLEYNLFNANADWDLTKQNDGQISLLNGGNTDLWFAQQYIDFKFTINVKDHPGVDGAVPRNQLLIMFTDGQLVTFDVTTHATAGYDFIQSFGGSSYLLSWGNHGALTAEESAQYRSEEGIDFTVMRRGQYFTLFIGSRAVKVVDMSSYISMDTKCGLRFRHFDDAGVQLDYDIYFEDNNRVPVTITGLKDGEVNNLDGVTVKVANAYEIVWPAYNENGELVASLVEGIDYQFIADGYHSQIINVQEGSVVQLEAHTYGDWVVTTPATLAAAGEKQQVCSCGDVITEEIPCLANVESWNLTLGDDLSVNFVLDIHEDIANTAKIVITVAGTEHIYDAAEMVSVNVAAAQMNDTITVQIVNGDDASTVKTYTVLQYAQYVLGDESLSNYHQLVKEMLNYGGFAQIYFEYNDENPVNADLEGVGAEEVPADAAPEMAVSGKVDGISFYGASLLFRNKIAVRYYFTVSGDISSYSFTVNGVEYQPELKEAGLYYIEVADINPQDLDDAITVAVNETLTVSYSPMNYIVRMSTKGTDNLQALMKAIYNYHLAAEAISPDVQ